MSFAAFVESRAPHVLRTARRIQREEVSMQKDRE
jgi:hypothetical protein